MKEYLLLLAGFIFLITSGRYLVKSSVSIALRYKVSRLVVGLTVVAFGTSAPELFVSVMAAIENHPGISIGNVVGSNIVNIAMVLALTSVIFPVVVKRKSIVFDWSFMMFASILFFLFILDGYLQFFEGLIFVSLLSGYIILLVHQSRKRQLLENIDIETPDYSPILSFIIVLVSSAGLAFGSDLLVKNAVIIAEKFHVNERVISITLIAFGTSVPELTTSVIAAFRKEMDISIGNIIGSNIFNILGVLGITAIIKKIVIPAATINFDIYWMLGVAVLLFVFLLPFNPGKLTRLKGTMLFAVYCLYVYLLYIKM
ncbi:MAG: calcium/sodium antiporter [Bacteroidales bacterium]|nr:calcium/sodium antiporter [Bacteroidales bacterium]